MTEVRLPSSPQPTASSPLDIERSVTTTCGARSPWLGASAVAVNGAIPRPGALNTAAIATVIEHLDGTVATRCRRRDDNFGARERRRVGDHRSTRSESGEAGVDALFQGAGNAVEDLLGIGVHPGDRRAGQDVMELLGEHLLPRLVELARVGVGAAQRGGGGPQFRLAQQPLTPPVAELGPQLAGERSPMGLEVQLATPHRDWGPAGSLGLDVFEEPRRGAELDAWQRVEVGETGSPRQHLAGRTAPAVSIAEGDQ